MADRATAAPDAVRRMEKDAEVRTMDIADEMEVDLGLWLHRRAWRLVARARATPRSGPMSVVSLWRALITVWCTSPAARQRYPAEARDGLLAALESMDDETALILIRGLVADALETLSASPTAA